MHQEIKPLWLTEVLGCVSSVPTVLCYPVSLSFSYCVLGLDISRTMSDARAVVEYTRTTLGIEGIKLLEPSPLSPMKLPSSPCPVPSRPLLAPVGAICLNDAIHVIS